MKLEPADQDSKSVPWRGSTHQSTYDPFTAIFFSHRPSQALDLLARPQLEPWPYALASAAP
jgi:hypothetical protein